MRELRAKIREWHQGGHAVVLATVVRTWGSAPRPIGAKLAIADDGEMVGSVSGGCVEAAVIDEAREVLASGRPKLLKFGVTADEAWAVGLSCGGEIEVFVEPLES
jgi:xanthine dehydrogenase accessory factor